MFGFETPVLGESLNADRFRLGAEVAVNFADGPCLMS